MKKLYSFYMNVLGSLRDVPPLLFRLILAYGFFEPAMNKLSNIESVSGWFASMNYPFPVLNAYLAGTTEALGVILLTLGLGLRFISAPLIFVMLIAITTVHWSNGFAASQNGYEIALYFLLMLFSLLVGGAGRFSLDYLISERIKSNAVEECDNEEELNFQRAFRPIDKEFGKVAHM